MVQTAVDYELTTRDINELCESMQKTVFGTRPSDVESIYYQRVALVLRHKPLKTSSLADTLKTKDLAEAG